MLRLRILEDSDKGPFGFGILPAIQKWLEDVGEWLEGLGKESKKRREEKRKELEEKRPREEPPYILPTILKK